MGALWTLESAFWCPFFSTGSYFGLLFWAKDRKWLSFYGLPFLWWIDCTCSACTWIHFHCRSPILTASSSFNWCPPHTSAELLEPASSHPFTATKLPLLSQLPAAPSTSSQLSAAPSTLLMIQPVRIQCECGHMGSYVLCVGCRIFSVIAVKLFLQMILVPMSVALRTV